MEKDKVKFTRVSCKKQVSKNEFYFLDIPEEEKYNLLKRDVVNELSRKLMDYVEIRETDDGRSDFIEAFINVMAMEKEKGE